MKNNEKLESNKTWEKYSIQIKWNIVFIKLFTSLHEPLPVCLKGGKVARNVRWYWSKEEEGAILNWGMFSVFSSMTLEMRSRPNLRARGSLIPELIDIREERRVRKKDRNKLIKKRKKERKEEKKKERKKEIWKEWKEKERKKKRNNKRREKEK